MKLGLTPALNAQQAYVCRDSYDLRCGMPLLLNMLFHVPENDPVSTIHLPCHSLQLAREQNECAFILSSSAKLSEVNVYLMLFPHHGVGHLAFSASIAGVVRLIVRFPLSVFGGVK